MKYRIDLTTEQLSVIQKACEFYSRFLAGQWEIPDELQWKEYEIQDKYDGFWGKRNRIEQLFKEQKSEFMRLHLNESYGIGSENLHEYAKVSYDIYRPILEQFTKEYNEKNPDNNNYSVYDHPGSPYSKQGRIKIETIKNEE